MNSITHCSVVRRSANGIRRCSFAASVVFLFVFISPANGQVPACLWYAAADINTHYDSAEAACRGYIAKNGWNPPDYIYHSTEFVDPLDHPRGAYCFLTYGSTGAPTNLYNVGLTAVPPQCIESGQQPGGAIDPTKNAGSGEGTCPLFAGYPINVGTGNKVLEENDYAAAELRFGRSYNHLVVHGGTPLTTRWTHTFSRPVALSSGSGVPPRTFAFRADGRMLIARLIDTQIVGGEQRWALEAFNNERFIRRFNADSQPVGWTLITADDTTESYDTAGRLTSVRIRSGAQQTLSYSDGTEASGYVLDAQGNPTGWPLPADLLIRVADAYGRQLTLGYNAQSRLIKLTDPASGIYRYGYDGAGNLQSVIYPDSRQRQYLYNESAHTGGVILPHALTGVIDEKGHRLASYEYDAQGRGISSKRWADTALTRAAGTATLTYAMNADGQPVSSTVTDGLGTVRTYPFTTILGLVKDTGASLPGVGACGPPRGKTRAHDANGNLSSVTDFENNVTQYGYDLTRNLETRRVEGLKDQSGAVVTTADTRATITSWHATFRLPFEIKEYSGGVDAGGNPTGTLLKTTRYIYDSFGNLTQKDEIAPSAATRTWRWTYTTNGRVLTATDPNNRTTTSSYHADNDPDLGKRGNVASITKPPTTSLTSPTTTHTDNRSASLIRMASSPF